MTMGAGTKHLSWKRIAPSAVRLDKVLLEYQPQGWARLLAWLLVLALCVTVFLFPCIAAVWYLGRSAGFVTVAISAAAWFAATAVQPGAPPSIVIFANMVSRFVVFLVLVWVLDGVRGLLQRVSEASMTDSLTGLGNRSAFQDRGQLGIDAANRAGLPVSLMFIDLNGFKAVNDTRGHDAGDQVLREVSTTIREGIRRSDLAARLGGDEFAVLLLGSDAEAALGVAEKLGARLVRNSLHGVTLSIGIATSPRAQVSLETMLSEGDRLMYEAKKTGDGAISRHTLAETEVSGRTSRADRSRAG